MKEIRDILVAKAKTSMGIPGEYYGMREKDTRLVQGEKRYAQLALGLQNENTPDR